MLKIINLTLTTTALKGPLPQNKWQNFLFQRAVTRQTNRWHHGAKISASLNTFLCSLGVVNHKYWMHIYLIKHHNHISIRQQTHTLPLCCTTSCEQLQRFCTSLLRSALTEQERLNNSSPLMRPKGPTSQRDHCSHITFSPSPWQSSVNI